MLKKKVLELIEMGLKPAYIAKRAGVSKATMSLWLNKQVYDISEATKDKIETAINDIAYEINAIVFTISEDDFDEF